MPVGERDAAGIGALADPIRRGLYLFVCAQPTPVSRDHAADAVGIPRHQAKFHLDKLEAEGLLESEYARLAGRRGPGAGRPSKLYRRAAREIAVSLPHREYELAGRLMADAIAEAAATGAAVVEALHRLAAQHGRAIGQAAVSATGRPDTAVAALELAVDTLRSHGYEPRRDDGRVVLDNCPFHALAQAQTELVCGTNHALIEGLVTALEPHCPQACLEPAADRCCVVLRPDNRESAP
jgi:predicted ArsR family transcriptional regulator